MTVGGVVACADIEHHKKVKFYQNIHGSIMSPMVAFLQLQTCKTMTLRCVFVLFYFVLFSYS